ncbi:unnamed protein product [Owenia fusiformis]|uniref:Uncharacterized protein n=1 Tax=Owenia fusiformis TaxID=6347 RepID=A0A8J1XQY7_OWEFU|nr:unnamed protein product [Owenia fusiformis]
MDNQSNNTLITFTPLEIGLISAGIVLLLLFLILIAWVAYYFWRRHNRRQFLEKQYLKEQLSFIPPPSNEPLRFPPKPESENVAKREGYHVRQSSETQTETSQPSLSETQSVVPLSTVPHTAPAQYDSRQFASLNGEKEDNAHAPATPDGAESATEAPPINSVQYLSPYNYYNTSEINKQIDAYINNQPSGDAVPKSDGINVIRFPVEVDSRSKIGILRKTSTIQTKDTEGIKVVRFPVEVNLRSKIGIHKKNSTLETGAKKKENTLHVMESGNLPVTEFILVPREYMYANVGDR